MQIKLPPKQEHVEGGECNCLACRSRRAVSEMLSRPRATPSADIPASPPPQKPPASAPAKPPKSSSSKAVTTEKSARELVKAYLVYGRQAVGWDTVIGNEEAREALIGAVEHPVTQKDLYSFYGRMPPRGVLLHGAPGCGKTLLARATAGTLARLYNCGAEDPVMLSIKGPELQTPYVGMSEKIVRDIFAYARAYSARYKRPLLIFIDEADALLPAREGTSNRNSASYEASLVAAMLAEMDGFEGSEALVLLATNRADSIDEAILRPGRIDLKIRVERPTQEACIAILEQHLKEAPLAVESLPRTVLAQRAVSYLLSPAHVLAELKSDVGPLNLTLRHIVSGALLSSLAQMALGRAFDRDLKKGSRTGLMDTDLTAAVDDIQRREALLRHPLALRELCEAAGASFATLGNLPEDQDSLSLQKAPVFYKFH